MPTITMTRGIPGSGKSKHAREWAAADPENRVRVNRDDIRRMISGTEQTLLSHSLEQHVSQLEMQIALIALAAGKDVIIDATNLRAKFVRPWLALGYPVRFIDFPVSLDLALARNEARGGTVPEEAIRRSYDRLTLDGELPPPPIADAPPRRYVPNLAKPSAIIVDIDGTLAHMDGKRSPYDWKLVGSDSLDQAVAWLLELIGRSSTTQIILMSGRDAVCRQITEQWLDEHRVPWDHLFMRPEGDMRADTVVKRELFNGHVRDNFNVHFAVDDRDSVVRMWRSMGIKCFQAQEGAF